MRSTFNGTSQSADTCCMGPSLGLPQRLAVVLIGAGILTGALEGPSPDPWGPPPPEWRHSTPTSPTWTSGALSSSGNCYWIRDRNAAYLRPADQAHRHKYSLPLETATISVQTCEGVGPDAAAQAYP
jgi:hypothetical protein